MVLRIRFDKKDYSVILFVGIRGQTKESSMKGYCVGMSITPIAMVAIYAGILSMGAEVAPVALFVFVFVFLSISLLVVGSFAVFAAAFAAFAGIAVASTGLTIASAGLTIAFAGIAVAFAGIAAYEAKKKFQLKTSRRVIVAYNILWVGAIGVGGYFDIFGVSAYGALLFLFAAIMLPLVLLSYEVALVRRAEPNKDI